MERDAPDALRHEGRLARGHAWFVVKLRWPIVLGWVAAVVAASVFTSFVTDVSEMPAPAPVERNPRASAVIVPAPLMEPPNVCRRTVAVPATMF